MRIHVVAGPRLGCMAILMIQHLTGGEWGTVIRRLLEAAMMTLPLMAALFIPIAVRHCRDCISGRGRKAMRT